MDIGIAIPFSHRTPVDYIASAARLLEDMGFAAMWAPEHVLFFPNYESTYPYSDDGRIPGEPDGLLDPFSALTFAAAHTSRIRLGTGICLVPQRQPVYTAKLVADLDYLSGGRVNFGVGIGWLKEEFENLQMDYAARARRCAEYIDAMKALWTQPVATFDGPTVKLAPCYFNPKPAQRPHPPIFFGGESEAALNRVATQGDGWYGFNLDPNGARAAFGRLDERLRRAGRDPASVRRYVGAGRLQMTPDMAAAYADAGVEQLVLGLFATNMDDLRRRADRLAASVGMTPA